MGTGISFPRGKAAGACSHPSSAEVKKGGAIPPLPHMSSWHNAYLIKHRDNFTSYNNILKCCNAVVFKDVIVESIKIVHESQ
jgi:hypothetical protein